MREFRTKFRLRRALTGVASIVGASAIAIGIGLPAGAAVTAPANHTIIGSGSSTTYSMMQSIDSIFNNSVHCGLYVVKGTQPLDYSCPPSTGDPLSVEASPTATPENPFADLVAEESPIGSSNGIAQLEYANSAGHTTSVNVANNVNFARSSRASKSSDYAGLNFVAYATDSISWFHFTGVKQTNGSVTPTPSANVNNLSSAQLTEIFEGKLNNWDQVGGANAPIVVFSAQEGSGTQSTFSTWLGYDPSASSNQVNCTDPGTYSSTTNQVTGESGCVGPAIIFENEDASVNINSFLPDQSSFLAANPKLWTGSGSTTTTKTGSTTVTALQPAGTAKLTVKSVTGIAKGSTITVGTAANKNLSTASVTAISGKTLTLSHTLKYRHVVGAAVKWSTQVVVTGGGGGGPATNAEIQGDAIFFYSEGLYTHQCSESTSTVNECGGSNQNGNTNKLGEINGATANEATTLTGTFPITRFLYNVYSNGSNSQIGAAAQPWTLNYVSEDGFICKPQNASIINPATGNSYTKDIQAAMLDNGFYPLSAGDASGVVNQTPISDEGQVAHTAASLLSGSAYAAYTNTPSTGLSGGPKFNANGDPEGFCLVSSTDGNSP